MTGVLTGRSVTKSFGSMSRVKEADIEGQSPVAGAGRIVILRDHGVSTNPVGEVDLGQWVDNNAGDGWNLVRTSDGYDGFQAAGNTGRYLTGPPRRSGHAAG
jgi:hypothetical protein